MVSRYSDLEVTENRCWAHVFITKSHISSRRTVLEGRLEFR